MHSIFFFNDPATTEIYPLSLHDALPISPSPTCRTACGSRRSPPRAVRWQPALHSPPGSLETYPEPAAGPSWRTSTSETPFSHRTRAAALTSMAAEPVDVLVIGAGSPVPESPATRRSGAFAPQW